MQSILLSKLPGMGGRGHLPVLSLVPLLCNSRYKHVASDRMLITRVDCKKLSLAYSWVSVLLLPRILRCHFYCLFFYILITRVQPSSGAMTSQPEPDWFDGIDQVNLDEPATIVNSRYKQLLGTGKKLLIARGFL